MYIATTNTCSLLLLFFTMVKTAADWMCPQESAQTIRGSLFRLSSRGSPTLALQRGLWHRVPCLQYRPREPLDGVIWYKGDSDSNKVRLISRMDSRPYPTIDRYDDTSDLSLVIKEVKESDEGPYFCRVIPRDTLFRDGLIRVKVIGDSFPASEGDKEASASLQRGRRWTLPCDCTPDDSPDASISVVYWSTGEGVSTDTEIIGARFADGSVLQIQHNASYGIRSDFSLEINSLVGVPDEQRFWCHVIKSDGTRSSCYINVTITGEPPSDHKLRASKSSFYLFNGKPAILPCTSWEPGYPACDVQWLKVDNNSDRHMLSYNLSRDDLKMGSGFHLASDFGLTIESAHSSHSGRYSCRINSMETNESLEVRIIGSHFPLDGGDAVVGETIKLKPNTRLILKCPVEFNNIVTNKTTIFWSFGATDEQQSTTVIGSLVLPEGIRSMSDLGDNRSYGISYEGSLVLTNCSQDNDVRYWCHVLKEGEGLQISYVDVTCNKKDPPSTDPPSMDPPSTDRPSTDRPSTDPPSTDPPSPSFTREIVIIVAAVLIILLLAIILAQWFKFKAALRVRNVERPQHYTVVKKEDLQQKDV